MNPKPSFLTPAQQKRAAELRAQGLTPKQVLDQIAAEARTSAATAPEAADPAPPRLLGLPPAAALGAAALGVAVVVLATRRKEKR